MDIKTAGYYATVEAEATREFLANDPVARSIKYARFLSRSKGRRGGRQRLRHNPKEIHLVKYNDGFHLWHRFPFDIYATEITGDFADGEMLKEQIINLWGY